MNVTKCNQDNAIKVAAFAIEFDSQVSSSEIEALYEYCSSGHSDFFHNERYLEGFSVQFTLDGNHTDAASNRIGVSLIGPDSWELIYRDNLIVFQTTNYASWEKSLEYFNQSISFFFKFLSSRNLNKRITTVGLDFLDEFIINDHNSSWITDLFCRESKYLPSFVFEQNNFWHAHIGFYRDQVLNIANLDYVCDKSNKHIQRISALHRFRNLQHEIPSDISPTIVECFNTMHSLNVELVKDLLTKEVLNDIGFEE